MTRAARALFDLTGEVATPTQLACGPWSADTLHGGAVAALVAQLADLAAPGYGGHVARLALQLLRPVPLAPLRVTVKAGRDGRRVISHTVSLHADGTLVAAANALRIRANPDTAPPPALARPSPPSGPSGAIAHTEVCAWPGFNQHAIELRHVADTDPAAGAWTRLLVPVIAGHTTPALARAAASADLAGGIGAALPADQWCCVNTDLTLHLERLPAGDWIALRAATHIGTDGAATAEAELFDVNGRIGRAEQALVIGPTIE